MNSNKAKKLTALMLAAITVSSIGLENIAPMGINTCEAVVRKTVRKRIVATKPSAEETPTQTESSPDIVNSSSAGGVTGEISPSGSNSRSSQTVTQGGKLVAAASSGLISAKTGSSIIKPVTRNPVNSGAAGTKPLLGDVNGDGKVSLTDLSLLKGFIAGTISEDRIVKTNADLNGDGKISTTDLSLLKTAVMGRDEAKQDENKVLGENIEEGLYSLRPACAPNLELTVENASMEKGANVFLWDINSNWHTQPSHQKWRISRVEGNWYKIEAENSGLALNIHNGISANGTNVSVWPFGGNMHQFIFFKTGDGYYFIQGRVLGSFMLDVENAGSVPGTNVSIHEYNGSNAQKWKLVKVNGAAASVTPTPGSITQTTKEIAQRYATVYTNAELTAKQSNRWIGKGEEYTVVREYEKSLEVQYYSSKGEPRSGFVNKNIREVIIVSNEEIQIRNKIYQLSNETYGEANFKNNTTYSGDYQCRGFANQVYTRLFAGTSGFGGYTDDNCGATSYSGSYICGANLNVAENEIESLKSTFAEARAGAFIQIAKRKGNPHSAILVEFDGKGITLYEANTDWNNTIKVQTYTWEKFAKSNKGFTIYLPYNYALK